MRRLLHELFLGADLPLHFRRLRNTINRFQIDAIIPLKRATRTLLLFIMRHVQAVDLLRRHVRRGIICARGSTNRWLAIVHAVVLEVLQQKVVGFHAPWSRPLVLCLEIERLPREAIEVAGRDG